MTPRPPSTGPSPWLALGAVGLTLAFYLKACIAMGAPPSSPPWSPGPPDPCSGVITPCAQIADFTLTGRVTGGATWPGSDYRWAAGGGVGVTASLLKTFELGLSLPLQNIRSAAGDTGVYGPPELRVRVRLGPRMGVPPFGRAWPRDEPFYKNLPADYDVRPARSTAALGVTVRPLWPGVKGTAPGCPGDERCLAEVGVSLGGDLRLWRLLMTLHGEVRVPGGGGLPDAAYIMAGARAALDFFGDGVALFAEAGYRQNINEVAQRDARVLGGLQFLPFRGVRVTGWYGRELAGGSIAGFIVDVPLGIHGYSLRDLARLTAAVDPFVAGDGWMYSDTCQPLFRIGSPSGLALVHNESRRDSIAVGTHLWRRGGTLYRDQAAREPYMPVLPKVGTPAPVSQSWPFGVSAPWPDFHEARQLPETAQRWLRRFALAPDPDKSGMCAELLEQMIARMEAAERAPTLADRCREVEELAARTLAAAPPDEHRRAAAGAGMAAVLLRAQFCNPKTSGVDLSAALAALRVAVGRPAAPTKSDAPQPAQSALPLGPAQRSVLPPGPPAPSPQMAAHGAQAQGGGAAKPPTRGGTYLLFDEEGRVVRTGRTKDLERRRREHALDGATREYRFEADKHTDDYAEQRGREQIIHDRYRPRLNKIEPISPRNPRRQEYLDAGKKL